MWRRPLVSSWVRARDFPEEKSVECTNGNSALLLIAGVELNNGMASALKASANDFNSRYGSCHLVWCVKTKGTFALARLLPCLPSPYKMRGSNMGTNTMTTSDKAFKITVYITGHDMKNVSDATHMSLPSELLDSVTRKYREESVDSSITVMDNNLSGRDIINYSLNDTLELHHSFQVLWLWIICTARYLEWMARSQQPLGSPPDYNRFGYSSPSPTYRTCTRIHGGVYEGSQLYIYCNNSFSSTQLQ